MQHSADQHNLLWALSHSTQVECLAPFCTMPWKMLYAEKCEQKNSRFEDLHPQLQTLTPVPSGVWENQDGNKFSVTADNSYMLK